MARLFLTTTSLGMGSSGGNPGPPQGILTTGTPILGSFELRHTAGFFLFDDYIDVLGIGSREHRFPRWVGLPQEPKDHPNMNSWVGYLCSIPLLTEAIVGYPGLMALCAGAFPGQYLPQAWLRDA